MEEPLENLYFNWLCAKVLDPGTRNYQDLLVILYKTEFVWIVSADRHRVTDALELRQSFLKETHQRSHSWEEQPCSVLEILIAFAMRALFQTNISVKDWFIEFLTNLGLSEYRHIAVSDVYEIENILNTFIWRTYDPMGYGGLFPLTYSDNDQRQIEIWYQFCEYLDDRGLV